MILFFFKVQRDNGRIGSDSCRYYPHRLIILTWIHCDFSQSSDFQVFPWLYFFAYKTYLKFSVEFQTYRLFRFKFNSRECPRKGGKNAQRNIQQKTKTIVRLIITTQEMTSPLQWKPGFSWLVFNTVAHFTCELRKKRKKN